MGNLGLNRNKRYHQGFYFPVNKGKFIGTKAIYRSGLELKYFEFLDKSDRCVKWNSEGVTVPYFWNGKYHTYYIDLAATFKEGAELVTYLIEIKPFRQTLEPKHTPRKHRNTLLMEQAMYSQNIAKWKAAREFAAKHNFKFIILTEKNIK